MTLFTTVFLILIFFTDNVFTECNEGCQNCSGSICLTCDSSYFFYNGICSKCPADCNSCISYNNCTSCQPKRYGLHARCAFTCDNNCLNGECQEYTGYCTQCKTGLYGPKCQQNCSLCKDERCDLRKCSYGCREGYYEFKTNVETFCLQCPTDCTLCKDAKTCHKCKKGFNLYKFNDYVHCLLCSKGSQCSDYCMIQGCDKCQINNNSLICTYCPDGQIFIGGKCESNTLTCSTECSTYCDRNGKCQGECNDGWTGERCSERCFDRCLKCSKETSNICQQCKRDFYSFDCSLVCNPSCIVEDGKHTCRSSDGYCLNGCKGNFWDEACNKTCPVGCKYSMCDISNGTCTEGCQDGYTGDKCLQTTTWDQIGSTISTDASSSQRTTESIQEKKQDTKTNDSIIIGAAVGGGVLVLLMIIVLGVCLLKRRRKSANAETTQSHNDAVVKEDQIVYAQPIKNAALIQESQDYIYAKPDKSHKQKKPSLKEISKPKNLSDNITIDLDDEKQFSDNVYATVSIDRDTDGKAEETDIDELNLEDLDDGSSKLIETEVKPPSADLYYNTESLIRSRMQISDFLDYSKKKTDYESEFEKLQKGLTRTCDVALMRSNRMKNRYNGVYAYDATRVVLHSKIYINANYIDGYRMSPEYIASLGPTKTAMNDFKDFWEMVWQERTDKIIMLTNLEESGKMKCEQYWPDQGKTKSYQGYKVICIAESVFSEFTLRELTVSVKGSEPRRVTQYHYTAWPDRSVPDNVASLIEFRNKVEQTKSQDAGPIVVHCSAGIGRTGTYIALDTLTNGGKVENYIDIFGRVMALRGQRCHMVQNKEQYIFLHQCLLYALTCDPDRLPVTEIQRLMTDDKISHQFQTFTDVILPKDFDRKSSANKKIRKENRNGADIPGDQYRVRLCSTKHDYINAVYVNGYKNANKFIVTQTPLPNTVEDFIAMLYHEKCACVVDFDDKSLKNKSIGHYLPQDGKVFKVGHFQVTSKRFDTREYATIRDLTISRTGLSVSDGVHVKHYQYKGWTQSEKVPPRVEAFLKLIKDAEKDVNVQKSDRPITVHCLTGAERSCLFCAVSIISEKCFFEKEISVLNTICQLRSRRQTAFSDITQFRFFYHCVNSISTKSDKKQYYNMAKLL